MTTVAARPRRRVTPAGPADLLHALVGIALGPVLAAAAVLTAVVLVASVAGGAALSGVPAVVASLWLAAHGAPLDVDATRLGVLPLLPVLGLVWLTRRAVSVVPTVLVRGRGALVVLAVAVAAPLVLGAAAVTVLSAGVGGLPVAPASAAGALARVAGVHLLGAVLGLARPSGALVLVRRSLPRWARAGLAQAPTAGLALLAAAGVLVVLALLASTGTVLTLVRTGGTAAGGAGLVLLSLAYLPNVVVGGASVLVGPGAVVGHAVVTPLGAVGAPVPPLPVLAVLPAGTGSWWWPVLLLAPAAVAVLLGLRCARGGLGRDDALRAVVVAAVALGLGAALLGLVAGGALGGGAFTPVGVPVAGFAAATAGWFAVLGCAAVLVDSRLHPVVAVPVVDGPARDEVVADGAGAVDAEAEDLATEPELAADDGVAAEDLAVEDDGVDVDVTRATEDGVDDVVDDLVVDEAGRTPPDAPEAAATPATDTSATTPPPVAEGPEIDPAEQH